MLAFNLVLNNRQEREFVRKETAFKFTTCPGIKLQCWLFKSGIEKMTENLKLLLIMSKAITTHM